MRKAFFIISFSVLFLPIFALAANIGDNQAFNIESAYDATNRDQVTATVRKLSNSAYFYFDDSWWTGLSADQQSQVLLALNSVGEEFDSRIYPILSQSFGEIWNPGIDRDSRIVILFHPMKETAGGYFNSADEYLKTQLPKSNEKEMIYINANQVTSSLLKSLIAHEFQHLITFNQKERLRGIIEDTWLNEARSEYGLTVLGYDSPYAGSNLEKRVKSFLDKPYDSLTEWKGQSSDYGVVNIFIQYLVDHYGLAVLKDSLLSSKVGIDSLNETLKKQGSGDTFSQIFTTWTIAVFLNDCNFGQQYCYFNQSLRSFRVVPLANFLPPVPVTSLSVTNSTKDWGASWYKFFGAKGNLTLEFTGFAPGSSVFKIPYLLEDKQKKYTLNFLEINGSQKGKIDITDFDKNYFSLIFIPSLQGKTTGFTSSEPSIQFSWTVSAVEANTSPAEKPISAGELLAKIESLKKEIVRLQNLLASLQQGGNLLCQSFSQDLYYGMTNSQEVRCLQQFLNSKMVYPENLITGNYFSLTVSAVKRYQALKGIIQTGYFGPLTRAAANLDIFK